MLVGYARVSTQDQNVHLQKDALIAAGCAKVYEDVTSGTKSSRAGLEEALGYLREGDTLVVWKLDRLGRSLKHLIGVQPAKRGKRTLSEKVLEKSEISAR